MGGGGNKNSAPPVKTADQIAQENLAAQQATLPGAAQLQFDIRNNPNYGTLANTQLDENVRRSVFGKEAGLSDVLIQQTLQQLLNPSALTPEQQAATDALRQRSIQQYQSDARNRANLGGGLYGGRSAQAENIGVGNLQNQFVNSDIARQDAIRNNALQTALSIYSGYRGMPLTNPTFQNTVTDPNSQLNAYTTARGQDIQMQMAQQQAQAQQRSALYGALGQAAGMALAPMTGGLSMMPSLMKSGPYGGGQTSTGPISFLPGRV